MTDNHSRQRGQALTEFVLTALLFLFVAMGGLYIARAQLRRFSEEMSLSGAALSAATFSKEEREKWGDAAKRLEIGNTVTAAFEAPPEDFRQAGSPVRKQGCRTGVHTFIVESDATSSADEARSLTLSSCGRDTGDVKKLHGEAGRELRSNHRATSRYLPQAALTWKSRKHTVASALVRQSMSMGEFRRGFASTNTEATHSPPENFNRDILMSGQNRELEWALAMVRQNSQGAQGLVCVAEACKGAPNPYCAGGAALQMVLQKILGSGEAAPLCPNLSRALKNLAQNVDRAARARIRFLIVAEPAAEMEGWGGLSLDKLSELE